MLQYLFLTGSMPFFIPFSYLTANTINYLAFFENGII
jgi:hypothetical protein